MTAMLCHSRSNEGYRFFFLSGKGWSYGLILSVALGLGIFLLSSQISPWIGVTAALAALTLWHMSYVSRVILALPHIAILIACLQYVFAAWLNYYWPPSDPTYDIGDNLPMYLSYAGPGLIALAFGWTLGLVKLKPSERGSRAPSTGLLVELDVVLGLGVLSFLAGRFVHVQSLFFVFLLLGNLRYVGVFGRMVVQGPGWQLRLAVVLGAEAFLASGNTMFHDLLLWSAWSFAIWVHAFQPKRAIILSMIAVAVLFLPALQEAKWRMRNPSIGDDPVAEDQGTSLVGSPMTGVAAWLSYMIPAFAHTITGNFDDQFLADTAVRYNQGWIVNRVMMIVPEFEPYADGSTLEDAAWAALVPRMLAPGKFVAGGAEHMARYAGIQLNENTAMTLGFAGEMYANFGLTGGVIACGLYALFFALVFRVICRRAFTHPLWWSLVPFIFYSALKAEDDVAFVLNWTVKACVLLVGVIAFLPHFRRALFSPVLKVGHLPGIPAGPAGVDPLRPAPLALH